MEKLFTIIAVLFLTIFTGNVTPPLDKSSEELKGGVDVR